MRGFANFDDGFRMESPSTACTFDNFFPLNGSINLAGGLLTLQQDFLVHNDSNLFIGGSIIGNNYTLKLREDRSYYTDSCGRLRIVTNLSSSLLTTINTLDFSPNNNFLAVGTNSTGSDNELVIYQFDGVSLTRVASAEQSINVNQVSWHPSGNYLAVALNSVSGNDIKTYQFNQSTFVLTETEGWFATGDVRSLAWHPSGNFLVLTGSNTSKSIALFSFASGVLTELQIINPSSAINATNHTISWAPGGNYVAIGYGNRTGFELEIFNFDGALLTSTVGIGIGQTVSAVDWSPTGTFIAVGLSSGFSSSRLRIYQHNVTNGTLTEATNDSGQTVTVSSVDWSQSGKCLMIGTSSGSSSLIKTYDFDPINQILTDLDSVTRTGTYRFTTRSADDQFVALSVGTGQIEVFSTGLTDPFFGVVSDFVLSNLTLALSGYLEFRGRVFFNGSCRIDGGGATLAFKDSGSFFVRPGSTLTLQDVTLTGITSDNFACVSDGGNLVLQNVKLNLSADYTFSKGAFLVQDNVLIDNDAQTRTFNFSARRTSSINSYSQLMLDSGIIFNYAPPVAKNNLLFMTNVTSKIYLNGTTLSTTFTGLKLDIGTLLLDNHVTISAAGRNSGESLQIGQNLTIRMLSDSLLDLYGPIKLL